MTNMGMLYPPSVFYPPIRVLSPHLCFIPPSVFYPPIRVLSPHPCFILSCVFYPPIRVLSPHPCFIPPSVFYPPIRVLSSHPCFIPPSVFYPPIRVLSPHPCFIPSSVFYPLIRIRIRPSVSVSVFYPNPCSFSNSKSWKSGSNPIRSDPTTKQLYPIRSEMILLDPKSEKIRSDRIRFRIGFGSDLHVSITN